MGIFDRFKKKQEPHYDVSNITVHDLGKEYILDYDGKSWIVEDMFEYDWGDNNFSRGFKISEGSEILDLHIEIDHELEIALTKKIPVRKLSDKIIKKIKEKGRPPKTLVYEEVTYHLENEYPGYCRNVDHEEDENSDSGELIMWLYMDDAEEKLINIEQWGDKEFNAKIGEYLSEYDITNILPSKL